jgi:hypothetical protein
MNSGNYFLRKTRFHIPLSRTRSDSVCEITAQPVLVKPTELPPVDVSAFIRFTVEHVWINTTDSKTVVINPAPSVLQEQAGSTRIILRPQSIPRNIKYAVLVAKFGCRCWFESFGIK